MTISPNVLLHGSVEPLPEVTALLAGPLSMIYTEGEIRYVRLAGREVLRRLYVAVRDSSWSTVPSRVIKTVKEILPDSFRITVQIESKLDDIDFYWRNSIVGEARGRILFRVTGTARSRFFRNRIGLCVLFPASECQAVPCVATGIDGKKHKSSFPEFILPHQPFRELAGISYEPFPGAHLNLRFRGDIFEMEDQRNWGDASFKIYSTPLELPIPVEVQKGTVISQSATIKLENRKSTGRKPVFPPVDSSEPITISFDPNKRSTMPRIGLALPTSQFTCGSESTALLRQLNFSHLRVDLHLHREDYKVTLERGIEHSHALNLPLELALFLSPNYEAELDSLAELLKKQSPSVCTVLVFASRSLCTNLAHLEVAREKLSPLLPTALFGGGTDSNFAEINRSRPSVGSFDLLSCSYNPQIHSTDWHSLVENLDGIQSVICSARQFAPNIPIAISPLSLKPRYRPDNTPYPLVDSHRLDPLTDPRQASLFGAGLSVGILKQLAEAGIYSATCFESCGPRGIVQNDSLHAKTDRVPRVTVSGRVFPLFHAFASALSRASASVISTSSSSPYVIQSLAFQQQSETHMLLANLSPNIQKVRFIGLPLGEIRTKSLDESNLALAKEHPDAFGELQYSAVAGTSDSLKLDFQPWAVTSVVGRGLCS